MGNPSLYIFIVDFLESIEDHDDRTKCSEAIRRLQQGITLTKSGQPKEALPQEQQALAILKSIPKTIVLQGLCHLNIAEAYVVLKDYEKSLNSSRLAISMLREATDLPNEFATGLHNTGASLIALGKAAEGIQYLHQALLTWLSIPGQEQKVAICRENITAAERVMQSQSGGANDLERNGKISLFSRLFSKQSSNRVNVVTKIEEIRHDVGEKTLCDWIMARMKQGPMTADELSSHTDNCPICRRTMERRKETRAPVHVKVSPDEFPTVMIFGIDGPFDLQQILFMARKENRDLVVMGNRSPAFKDPNILLIEAPKFLHDPNLVLSFEKHPTKLDPLCLDPMVIVRRTFLLDVTIGIRVKTIEELAIKLSIVASQKNLKVNYI